MALGLFRSGRQRPTRCEPIKGPFLEGGSGSPTACLQPAESEQQTTSLRTRPRRVRWHSVQPRPSFLQNPRNSWRRAYTYFDLEAARPLCTGQRVGHPGQG